MEHSVDVVVVGGGIAGNAIAKAAAERGLDVLVLERQTSYRDKVRGEVMSTWASPKLAG
jgi:flavin-dependent dehydrogenase